MLPSSTLRHGNTPIQTGESRYSIAQYCAGGLFRWVKYGFRSAKSLLKQRGGKRLKEQLDGPEGERWLKGLELFSKPDELLRDRENLCSYLAACSASISK